MTKSYTNLPRDAEPFPNILLLFTPPCVTARVTHVQVTSQKSCLQFSARLRCIKSVLFFDDSILKVLYIVTPPKH